MKISLKELILKVLEYSAYTQMYEFDGLNCAESNQIFPDNIHINTLLLRRIRDIKENKVRYIGLIRGVMAIKREITIDILPDFGRLTIRTCSSLLTKSIVVLSSGIGLAVFLFSMIELFWSFVDFLIKSNLNDLEANSALVMAGSALFTASVPSFCRFISYTNYLLVRNKEKTIISNALLMLKSTSK